LNEDELGKLLNEKSKLIDEIEEKKKQVEQLNEQYEQEMKELKSVEARLKCEHENEIENLKRSHETLMQQKCEKVICLLLLICNELL